jgi:hypothetical protein
MAESKDLAVNNEQFDRTIRQLAKVTMASSEALRVALERNTQAILAQTVEMIKAQMGVHSPATTDEAIMKSVRATFEGFAK